MPSAESLRAEVEEEEEEGLDSSYNYKLPHRRNNGIGHLWPM